MKQHKILRVLSRKTEDPISHEDHKRKTRFIRPLQYEKFSYVYDDLGNDYCGLTNYKTKTVFINIKKSLACRILTIGHESLHVWIIEASKVLNGKLLPKFANGCIDLLDYYLADFKNFYKDGIQLLGFKVSFRMVLDRYGFLFERDRSKLERTELKKRDKSTFSGKPKISGKNRVKNFIKRRLS